MLGAAAENWPIIEKTFSEASDVLGYDLWHLCQHGPAEELNQTTVTQPALLAASVALWRQWFVAGGQAPDFDAIKLVRLRGELMQAAVPAGEGKMAAIIGLEDDDVPAACAEAANGDVVAAVNFNAPGQVVIAGAAGAVERAIEACKARGARKAMPLPVSVPSHCALMKGAAEELATALDEVTFNDAVIPVIQNVTASVAQDSESLKANLVKQLYSPVLWTDTVRKLVANDVRIAVECGAGKVLAGLAKRIDRELSVYGIDEPDALAKASEAFGQ